MTLANPIHLTPQQARIAQMVADCGMSNPEVAAELGICTRTVKIHLWAVYKKLDISGRLELARLWQCELWRIGLGIEEPA